MNRSDNKCWFQCQPTSSPLIPPACQNDPQTAQNNVFQGQQPMVQSYNSSPPFGTMTGVQPGCVQSQPPYSSDPFANPQRSNFISSNTCQQQTQANCSAQPIQQQVSLSPAVLEQIRAYIAPSSPIFILPSSQMSQAYPVPSTNCPGVREPCLQPQYQQPPPYYPYPMPMPILSPFMLPNVAQKSPDSTNCSCCSKKSNGDKIAIHHNYDQHACTETDDEIICAKRNCPSAINLQALAAQLLAVPGVISCAATRLILRRIPRSNVSNSIEEVMERSQSALNGLQQEQLLTESRSAQQVGALINLHMTANPPANIVPVLTMVQLKVNALKTHADSLINRKVNDSHVIGAEGGGQLDEMLLGMKSDEELRQLLVTLRQKECDERVNFSFAPYRSQRVIAETRLRNVESKIRQVEKVMGNRRFTMIPRDSRHVDFDGNGGWHAYPGSLSAVSPFGRDTTMQPQTYDSPDPFHIEVRSPRRLNLKPHVGSPETTYEREMEQSKEMSFGYTPLKRNMSTDEQDVPNQTMISEFTIDIPDYRDENGMNETVMTSPEGPVQPAEKDTDVKKNENSKIVKMERTDDQQPIGTLATSNSKANLKDHKDHDVKNHIVMTSSNGPVAEGDTTVQRPTNTIIMSKSKMKTEKSRDDEAKNIIMTSSVSPSRGPKHED